MSSTPVRQSPSGNRVAFTMTTDDIENDSLIVPGTTVTDALNVLYGRAVNYLDTDDDPIALWNFDNTFNAVRGPNLSIAAGPVGFTDVYPGARGIYVDAGCRLEATADPSLILLGAMSVEIIIQQAGNPPYNWICGVGGTSGTGVPADNASWSVQYGDTVVPKPMGMFWEHTAGVDVTFLTSQVAGGDGLPVLHQVQSIGYSRTAGGIVQPYFDGLPFGPPSTALTMPTDGGNGIFSVGGQLGTTSVSSYLLLSIAVYDRARPAAEWVASYNRSVGNGLGFLR